MNVIKTKHNKKGLYAIVLFLVLSIILNFVLYRNLMSHGEVIAAEQNNQLEEKDQAIVNLQEKIELLEEDLYNSQPENKEEASITQLDKQRAYKGVAESFVNAYINYDSSHLKERRENIMSITHEDLIDILAPEVYEDEDSNDMKLSSDPTLVSTVQDVKVYITEVDENLEMSEVMADVKYITKNTEGESSSRSLIYLQLKKGTDGSIKVTDYTYYPIK